MLCKKYHLSVLTYEAEIWAWVKRDVSSLKAVQMKSETNKG